MDDLIRIEALLEQTRRSLVMQPKEAGLTRDAAIQLVEKCRQAVAAARNAAG